MKAALLSLALFGSNLSIPISDRVPELKVEALCQATTAIDKEMGLSEAQSLADCMRDETSAKQQLETIWQGTAPPLRDRCEGEASSAGAQSYVDLITCIQMTELASSLPNPSGLRGASKTRNKK
ncbi:hypothetical protein XI09_04415 [Bradyrhizobium sp. CCBAU 11386]|uniref:hypothetical protein n=1 Tax=Bradyrhizobium sp. CCBAU 11386 TaxID=1630837 RepID=UPI002304737A|nr:hypothetical protein [Bradyrhizobium sp. CCBAU 11386]MDA9504021.1 hypothetical protein [Bradyrhizobium sp. CCBAU 11386]